MTVAQDIAEARALFEKAERETNPAAKAQALQEAIALLDSCDPEEATDAEAKLIANVRLANTRRLLAQLVGMASVSMDTWFDYVGLLIGELRPEVERLAGPSLSGRRHLQRRVRPHGRGGAVLEPELQLRPVSGPDPASRLDHVSFPQIPGGRLRPVANGRGAGDAHHGRISHGARSRGQRSDGDPSGNPHARPLSSIAAASADATM